MNQIRVILLTATLVALTTATLQADPLPDPQPPLEPLQILADCLAAAESGDFAQFVDFLSVDEQRIQAGYILFLTRSMSRSQDLGVTVDPELSLLMRSLSDLVKTHRVGPADRTPEHDAGERSLARLNGEGADPWVAPSEGVIRSSYLSASCLVNDPHAFLVEVLKEISRPTRISGEEVTTRPNFLNVDQVVKWAKELKWTLYTRGDYAIATIPPRPKPNNQGPYAYSSQQPPPPPRIEFQRIGGQWKITRLMSASRAGFDRVALVNPYATEFAGPVTPPSLK